MSSSPELVEHFFRHEYARLVASLSRRVGVHNIEAVEDAAQAALMVALEKWKVAGPPENPSAWLFVVAHNRVIEELRSGARRSHILSESTADDAALKPPAGHLSGELEDDLLRMLFVCGQEEIPVESQLVLALKVLCGFDIREIAQRLFISEDNAYKRLSRARKQVREASREWEELSEAEHRRRLPAVHRVVYLLFTEGYLSGHAEEAIRRELCDEAVRLGRLLAEHPRTRGGESSALLALMLLHRARLASRVSESGGVFLLEEQDRSLWDREEIGEAMAWLSRSTEGDAVSRYHLEAAIALEHCMAPSLRETNWGKVVDSYALLERVAPSPLHRLNRAIALAEWKGPAAGLELLHGWEPPTWMEGSYLWAAVLADLHRRAGRRPAAERYLSSALSLAPSDAVRDSIRRRHLRSIQATTSR